ncbi:hypothetical protein [Roseivirga sp. E12]|uniref:hypothetical protein n=1 Tax=Roseivirga sp. E12 TaxID=2819237 RepID=UPI001ABD45E4|nr:hypothetical protein [Roseivirga sp. E12]MBO3699352.1 hypothetical protein [Roseivirga sp. E12]
MADQEENNEEDYYPRRKGFGSIGTGIAIGIGIGVAMDNIAIGIGVGIAMGLGFEMINRAARKGK